MSVLRRLRGDKEHRTKHMDVGNYINHQRTLVFSSRGIVHKDRHLMTDLRDLLPHSRAETKLDTKDDFREVAEIAEMKNCNNVIFFEARKHKDLYLWLGRCPAGPTAKFLVTGIHTMSEIKLTGNCLKGSRPLLQFDASFDETHHGILLKEMLQQSFGAPKGHPKIKPFVDHIFTFFYINGRIYFRNYQISYDANDNTQDEGEPLLVEVGPRFELTPIKVFNGSFSGNILWENNQYVSPNAIRAIFKKQSKQNYVVRHEQKRKRQEYQEEHQHPTDELVNIFK